MIKLFFFSFLSFFSINAAGLSQLEQYYDSDSNDAILETLVPREVPNREFHVDIPELTIDPLLVKVYTDPKSENSHIQAVAKRILKDLQEYSERRNDDHFDYAISTRALRNFEKELGSMENNFDKRISFMGQLRSCHNWAEYILTCTRLTCL